MADETAPTSEPTEAAKGTDRGAIVRLALALILVAAFVVFAAQNAASVQVDFLAWSFSMRRIVLMVASAVVGIAVWEMAGLLWRRRRQRRS